MIERRADLTGLNGHAWECHPIAHTPQATATLATFLLHMPGHNIFWTRYLLYVVHLRDILGTPPPNKHYPEAQYELALFALDPDKNPEPDDVDSWAYLTPPNAVVQFHGCDDTWARTVGSLATTALLNGILPIEPTYIAGGVEAWDVAIRETARHQNEHGRIT